MQRTPLHLTGGTAASALAVVLSLLGAGLASCAGPASRSGATSHTVPLHAPVPGDASVAYGSAIAPAVAGTIGAGFTQLTGYRFSGVPGDSLLLTREILSYQIAPDVFVSIGPTPIGFLEPRFTRWYVELATDPLVIAYARHGAAAAGLGRVASGASPPAAAFTALAAADVRFSRPDPDTSEQGAEILVMLQLAESHLGVAAGTIDAVLAKGGGTDFPSPTAIAASLARGSGDAAVLYLSDARRLHLPFVTLPASVDLGSTAQSADDARAVVTLPSGRKVTGAPAVLDLTVLARPGEDPANAAAAVAFAAYLARSSGLRALKAAGFETLRPILVGPATGVPQPLRAVLMAR